MELLARLRDPSIVRHLAHGQLDAETPFPTMEWLEGEDLPERLTRGPLALGDALALARRVLEGLALAHQHGVVHRDLEPSNLFLEAGDPARTKLLDFGVARPLAATRAMTGTGAIVGTIGYMAPEQAAGQRELDGRADLFSVGCIVHECATGERVFDGEHAVAILAKLMREAAPRLSERAPWVAPQIDELVAALLSKEPDGRPSSAGAVLEVLGPLSELPEAQTVAAAGGEPSQRARSSGGEGSRSVVSVLLVALGGGPGSVGAARAVTPEALQEEQRRASEIATSHGCEATALSAQELLIVLVRGTQYSIDGGSDQSLAPRCVLPPRCQLCR